MPRLLSLLVLPLVAGLLVASADDEVKIYEIVDLCDFIEGGKLDEVKALLTKKPNLATSSHPYWGTTPLHFAARYDHLEIAKLLLKQGAKVNAVNNDGISPLHEVKSPEIAKLLIANKGDLEAKGRYGTPLQVAATTCQYGDLAEAQKARLIAKVLLDAGAKYDILSAIMLDDTKQVQTVLKADPKEALDKTLIHEAAKGGRAAIVQLLLDHKADPNATDHNGVVEMPVAYEAIPHPDVVRVLLKAGVDPNRCLRHSGGFSYRGAETTLLHCAAELGHTETAKLLLEAGADIESRRSPWKETPLQVAASSGQPEMVKFLLKHKASIHGKDGTKAMACAALRIYPCRNETEVAPYKAVIVVLRDAGVPVDFHTAVTIGDTKRVRELVKAMPMLAAGKDRQGTPILAWAATLGHTDVVTHLLNVGAPVDGKTKSGSTALGSAVYGGWEDIVKVLIQRGADVNNRAESGDRPLHWAARSHTSAITKLLINAGARVNVKDTDGKTPLHQAASDGNDAAVAVLLRAGGDVNAADNTGTTPLHVAVRLGDPTVARHLLTSGANVNLKTATGRTPLSCTNEYTVPEMIDLLKKYGAK